MAQAAEKGIVLEEGEEEKAKPKKVVYASKKSQVGWGHRRGREGFVVEQGWAASEALCFMKAMHVGLCVQLHSHCHTRKGNAQSV